MLFFVKPSSGKKATKLKTDSADKEYLSEDEKNTKKFPQISGLFLLLISLYLAFSFTSYIFTWEADQSIVSDPNWDLLFTTNSDASENKLGTLGAILSHYFIYNWFGIAAYLIAFWTFLFGWKLVFKKFLTSWKKSLKYSLFILTWLTITLSFIFHDSLSYLGGAFGYVLSNWLTAILGGIGLSLLLFFSFWAFLASEFDISKFYKLINKLFHKIISKLNPAKHSSLENEFTSVNVPAPEIIDLSENPLQAQAIDTIPSSIEFEKATPIIPSINKKKEDISLAIELTKAEKEKKTGTVAKNDDLYDPTLDLSNYKFPTLDLLNDYGSQRIEIEKDELEANKNKIVETLGHYNIGIEKIKATIGPAVTLYEIIPTAGTKISKIRNLEDDIALGLAALGIRIIAPIPGKGTIGIEVPNSKPEIVSLKSLLGSEKFQEADMELPIALGKTISNEVFIVDLAKMPHILMAGATGQGKSVGINVILNSLLFKMHPSRLKFIMVDPKLVELSLYSKIEKFFLAKLPDAEDPIITDTKKVIHTLNSIVIEMESRYELLKSAEVRDIKGYNTKYINRQLNPTEGHRFLPYLVLVIDEFADLIMTAGKEVELPIARIAQKARAVGIHLIIATQRPSVNIITGTIKANFPARIAFKVTAKVDSRTILDQSGADQLVGRGDMLFSQGSNVIRIQCGFLDTAEVEKITNFISDQKVYPETFLLPEYVDETATKGKDTDAGDFDPMFDDAARVVVQNQQGSTSLIQRRLKLGYNRAGRIMDQLESSGIVGPFEGSKARSVLIPDELTLEQFLTDLHNKKNNSEQNPL